MHHIKSNARRQAYADPLNPFSRWRPKRDSTTSRAEQGISRVQSAPTNQTLVNRDKPTGYHAATDPNASSKHVNHDSDITEQDALERFTSPEDAYAADAEKRATYGDEPSSSSHLPQNNGNVASGTQPEAKKGHHISVPRFLGGKKKEDDATLVADEDNNGKNKKKQHFTLWGQIRATIFGSWINVLLIFSPIGIALHFAHVDDIIVFVVNFIAIIPLAGMLSYATEEIALRTGEVLGGLLNASFGNAVELIVSIIALFQDQYLIVQTSLIGSILSNLLLVLGMSFFLGGYNRLEQAFNTTVAQTAASLLFIAVSGLIIPTAFEAWAQTGNDVTSSDQPLVGGVIELSHATAIILLIIYIAYLFFQLKSHASMYSLPSQKNKTRFTEETKDKWKKRTGVTKFKRSGTSNLETSPPHTPPTENAEEYEEEDEREEPQLSLTGAIITLAASTVLVALNAEFLVDSINAVTCHSNGISKTFVGLILLPIVGNAAEHFTSISVAMKDKMDLAIGVAVGSSMQIALLVLPFVVVVGWMAGKTGMTLYFDGFQLAMLFVAILLVNYLIQDGKSHWLEGLLLMMLYIIIAVAAWFYPTSPNASGCES